MKYQNSFVCVKCKENHFSGGQCEKCLFETCTCCATDPYLKTCKDCGYKWRQSHFDVYCSDCKHNRRLGFKVVNGEKINL